VNRAATARAEVVVVGGGPVGLLLAAELAHYGVDTLVLERRRATDEQPKAGTLHARTVQSLARRGHLSAPRPPFGADPVPVPFHFAGITELTLTAPATEPPPVLKRPQADLERQFERTARARGVRVLRGHQVVEAAQDADGVRVTAHGPDGPLSVTAAYLVGADGPRSVVRDQCGFAAETRPASVSALMGRVRFAEPDAVPAGWHRTPRGWIVSRPDGPGHTLVRTLNCAGPAADRHAPVTPEELAQEISWIAGHPVTVTDAAHLTRFSDFTRVAHTFRRGRVLLAGDAAHVHFPIGGQGLSAGLLDALNLAWKLAYTVHGAADAGLLDTYDRERRPVVLRLVENTLAQLALMRSGPEADALRSLWARLLATPDGRALVGGLISAQDIVHPARTPRPSAWEGRFLENRALHTEQDGPTDVIRLLHDGRLLLLCTPRAHPSVTEAASRAAHLVRTVHVRSADALPCAALLLRPDGHVAWASDGGDLTDALTAWLGTPLPTAEGAPSGPVPARAAVGTAPVPPLP
jgi:monooxygenase